MSAMVFLPAGYALAGPVSSLIGVRAELLLAAAWIVASTAVVVQLPSIREFRAHDPQGAVGEVEATGAVDLA